jgi:hypothetical protein
VRNYDFQLKNYVISVRNYVSQLKNYKIAVRNYDFQLKNYETSVRNYVFQLKNYETTVRNYVFLNKNHKTLLCKLNLRYNLLLGSPYGGGGGFTKLNLRLNLLLGSPLGAEGQPPSGRKGPYYQPFKQQYFLHIKINIFSMQPLRPFFILIGKK